MPRPIPNCRAFLLVVLALATGACSSSGSGKASAPSTTLTSSAVTSPVTSPATTSRVKHVFIVNLENENYDTTWGPASPAKYLNGTLRPKGQLLTKYYAIGHASLDNYIAQISGQSPNPDTQGDCVTYRPFTSTGTGAYGQALGHGCVYPKSVQTIGNQLAAAGKTWKAYQEGIANSPTEPKTCRHPPLGATDSTFVPTKTDMYATRHDPWVYFASIIDSPTCSKLVVGLNVLTTDLRSASTTSNLSYITPDVCNDGHDAPCKDGRAGGLTSADAWLRQWVPKILASPAFKADGLLVITLDEAELGTAAPEVAACCHTPTSPNVSSPGLGGPGGGDVGALILSPFTKPATTNATPYNHYALLCSLENIFGLGHLGFAAAPGLSCFGKDVFDRAS